MFSVFFYKNKRGKQPVYDYIIELSKKKSKDSSIKLNKIQDYIQILEMYGLSAGEPYIKHLQDNIWELRPLRDRILFVAWIDNSFVLLHHFMKKTQKTPTREIVKAKKEIAEIEKEAYNDQ